MSPTPWRQNINDLQNEPEPECATIHSDRFNGKPFKLFQKPDNPRRGIYTFNGKINPFRNIKANRQPKSCKRYSL